MIIYNINVTKFVVKHDVKDKVANGSKVIDQDEKKKGRKQHLQLFITTHTDGEAYVIGESDFEDPANVEDSANLDLDDEDGKEKGRKEFMYNIVACSMSAATYVAAGT